MTNQENDILEQLIKPEYDEPPSAYQCFLTYANIPAGQRGSDGVKLVAEKHGLSENTITTYRVNYSWEERVNLIDAHFYKIQFNRRLEALDESNQKFAEDTKAIQSEAIRITKKALVGVEHLVDTLPLANKTIETGWVIDNKGNKIATKTTIQMEAKVSDIAPLLKAIVEVPLKAVSLPTEIVNPNVVKPLSDINQMSDDDIAADLERIRKEKSKIGGGNISNLKTVQ